MSQIKFLTKLKTHICYFHILKTDRIMSFCNFFMEWPSYCYGTTVQRGLNCRC